MSSTIIKFNETENRSLRLLVIGHNNKVISCDNKVLTSSNLFLHCAIFYYANELLEGRLMSIG